LQLSLDLVAAWADHWQLKLSPLKCSVLRLTGNRLSSHLGPSYTVGTHTSFILSPSARIWAFPMIIISILNRMFGELLKRLQACRAKCILKCFSFRDKLLLARAFSTFVRPLLEFSSVIWCPYYVNEIKKIEAVQRTFTKSIGNLRLYTYH